MEFVESEQLELKRTTAELDEAIISIVAMLNKHKKAELYFGISNDGSINGQDITDKTLRDITKSISDHIEPKVYPYVNRVNFGDKTCVHIKVQGENIPYFADGRAFIRIGTENRQISPSELKRMIVKNSLVYWDDQYSDKSIKDINVKILKEFISKAYKSKRINFEFTNTEVILRKLLLIKDGKLLNAAEVLFCEDNKLELQAAVFAGDDKNTFLDIKTFNGNIFDLLQDAELYLREHMNWRADLSGRKRVEIPEIPIRALSEALVNSFCHRDYFRPEGNKVAIFKDRIEIYNPGSFPENKTPEDFINNEEESILRNPTLAHNLFLSADIEKWGSGLKRIYLECKSLNINVKFLRLSDGFKVIFYRDVTPQVTPQASLTELEQKILKEIKKNVKISRQELSGKLNISSDTVKEYLERLKKVGVIRRIGKTSAGYWHLIGINKKEENHNKTRDDDGK